MTPAASSPESTPKSREPRCSVSSFRQMRLPVIIHLLALLAEVTMRGELVFLHPRGGVHDALGSVEHQQVIASGGLEVFPGHRDVFLINSEHTSAADHQVSDLACLRTQNDILDAAKPF